MVLHEFAGLRLYYTTQDVPVTGLLVTDDVPVKAVSLLDATITPLTSAALLEEKTPTVWVAEELQETDI